MSDDLYQEMFQAKQSGDYIKAEAKLLEIENLRNQKFPKPDPKFILNLLDRLPKFVLNVLDKSQFDLGREEKSNCINAAFNFFDLTPIFIPYSTMDFLERIQVVLFFTNPTLIWKVVIK